MKLIIWIIIGSMMFILNTLLITTMADWFIVGFAHPVRKKLCRAKRSGEPAKPCEKGFREPYNKEQDRLYDKEYLITAPNRMDKQKSTECSGFATAYVFRSFGMEAEGNELYGKMPGKLKNGAVLPKNVRKLVQGYGFPVRYVKGSLETLKADLCEGNRVIVLIKTRPDKRWLHYVPIVGYDEEHIFIAESMKTLTNCKEYHYNRALANRDFLQLWDTRMCYMPFYKNTYLVIGQQTSSK